MRHSITFSLRRISKSSFPTELLPPLFLLKSGMAIALAMAMPSLGVGQSQVELDIVDIDSREPVAARVEFTRSAKKLKTDRKTLAVGATWLAESSLVLQPPLGDYEFVVQRGPEFHTITGGFTIERGSRDTVLIEVPRSIDMHEEGWYSGDLGSDLPPDQLARWQVADAIDMVVQSSLVHSSLKEKPQPAKRANKQKDEPKFGSPEEVGHRWLGSSVEYRSSTVGLAVHRWPEALEAPTDPYEALEGIETDPDAFGEITQLVVGDLPVLLAHPKVRMARVLSYASRAKGDVPLGLDRNADDDLFAKLSIDLGKNRWSLPVIAPFPDKDQIRFRGPRGTGLLSEAIYWLALDAGVRIPPTAASGLGFGDTHLGYNRVYAYCESQPSPEAWWHAIVQGECFVTNGPLLRVMINEVPPGTVQASYNNQPIPLSIAVSLAVRDPVDYLDVIFNGETLYNAKLEDHYRKGEFPPIEINRSGWLVVRVVTSRDEGYRYATTAPFYFEIDGRRAIQRKAVEFFREWLRRVERSEEGQASDSPARRRAIERAKAFWEEKRSESN
jgi:hypothetical protein